MGSWNEEMCDDTNGKWDDDDPNADTGLDSTCLAPKVYIPSAGGWTK